MRKVFLLKNMYSSLQKLSRTWRSDRNRRRFQGRLAEIESLQVRVLLSGVQPYLQNPAPDAMTVMWFTETSATGTLTVNLPAGGTQVFHSTPVFKSELSYHVNEPLTDRLNAPYMHRIRVTGLNAGTTYGYTVNQGAEVYTSHFRTSPAEDSSVRFIVYGDTETTPAANGHFVNWAQPFGNENRTYVAEQTEGLRQNNNVIESRNPDFLGIAGDIVDAGGEQRDWDELWRHMAGSINNLGSSIPILATPGNHDDFGGVAGGYSDAGSIIARNKFSTYFESPDNGSNVPEFKDRYFRLDYGPITFISLDVSNGLPNGTGSDTNWLLGAGPNYPDFNPGSIQYQWLAAQLADAQATSRFTFVQLHHAPYSVGPHGFPAGNGTGFDNQSGQPVRVLTPLFAQYGVDAVFGGHDEMYQHSVVNGINFYEIGIAGDELRRPSSGRDGSTGLPSSNPYQTFLPHLDAPEVWNGLQLISGGKHYGHLEVNVTFDASSGTWKTQLDPVYVFPLMNTAGQVTGWERRIYNDTTILTANAAPTGITVTPAIVSENQPGGTTVGQLSSVDATGNTHLYSLATGPGDTDNSRFTIVGNTLKTAASFDYETKNSYAIRVRSTDQGGLTFEQNLTIRVSDLPESGPPVISSFDTPAAYRENGIPIVLDTNATIVDADSLDFAGGVLTAGLAAGAAPGDQLLIRDQGPGPGRISLGPNNTVTYSGIVMGSYTGGTLGAPLVVTLGPAGSKTAVQALVRNLTFNNLSENPSIVPRTVQLRLTDGDGGSSAPVIKTINVTAVNDVPVVSAFGDNLSYIEDGTPIIITTGALVSDADSSNFDTGKLIVRVLTNPHIADRIGIRHQGTNPGQIGISGSSVTWGGTVIGTFTGTSTLTVTLNGQANSISVQALLQNITFQNISQAPSILTRTISAVLTDGDGGTSVAVTKTVAVTALNDDPIVGGFDTTITYAENAIPILLDTNATVIDPDLKDFDAGILTVSITANGHANDRLSIRNQGVSAGLIGVNGGSVTWGGVLIGTFTGGTSGTNPLRITFNTAAGALAVQSLVRNLTFSHVSENPSTLPRTVQLRLTDGDGGTSAPVIKTINVTSINDAPLINGFNDPATYFMQGTPVILDFDATVTDVDAADFNAGSLTVSLTTNRQTTDRLSIAGVGNGPGQIRTSVNTVTTSIMDVFYEGNLIGSYPVASTTTLKVTLNSNSSSAAVGALLRRVTFFSTSAIPSTAVRTVQVSVNDGDGKTSLIAAKTITIKSPVTPAGVWTNGSPTANLSNNHLLGAATRLPNGKVIVAGGHSGGTTAVRTAEIYDPATRRWSVTGSLGTARWQLDAITLDNGKALFAGGASETTPASVALATAEVYDPATGRFSPTNNNLSVGRQGYGISRLNDGRILITGGNTTGYWHDGTGVVAVDIYNPVTNSFSAAAPMHSGRGQHAQVTLSDGRVLVIGGAQRDAELYDPATSTWSVSANLLPTTLKDMKAFELYNGRVFIAAGQNTVDGLTTDATWFFDVGTMQFTPGPDMAGFNYAVSGPQVGASDYSAFDLFPAGHPLHGRYVLFAGGENDPLVGPDVELNSASIYDALQNRFFNVGPMPFTHDDHTESLLQINAAGNPEVLIFGGGQTLGTSRFEFLISSLL